MTTPSQQPLLLGLCVLLLALTGCGGGSGKPVESESDIVAQTVREFNDIKDRQKGFADAWVKGSAPKEAERKRYLKRSYAPGSVSKSGDTATVKVKVLDESGNNLQGEVDWTYVKEGDKWKLKSAPLP